MKWRRLLIIIAILFSTIYASVYGGTISYLLFFSSLAVVVIAIAYLGYVYICFKIYQKIDARTLVKGQEMPYYFHLSNESKIPFVSVAVSFLKDVQEVKDIEDGKEYCLLPGESVKHMTKIIANFRGEYEMGIDSVTLRDCFELFTMTYCCKSTISVRVFPRIVKLKKVAFITEEEDAKRDLFKTSNVQEVPSGDTRTYVAGDDPKRIHWKLTACTDELIVKQYAKYPQLERVVLLDLTKPEGSELTQIRLEDKTIECAVAIVNYMVEQGILVKVNYDQAGFKERVMLSQNEFDSFYSDCAGIIFHKSCKTLDVMNAVQERSSRGVSYIIITCAISKELCAKCLEITENLGEVTVVNIEEKQNKVESLKIPGIKWYTIYPEEDLSVKLSHKGW